MRQQEIHQGYIREYEKFVNIISLCKYLMFISPLRMLAIIMVILILEGAVRNSWIELQAIHYLSYLNQGILLLTMTRFPWIFLYIFNSYRIGIYHPVKYYLGTEVYSL